MNLQKLIGGYIPQDMDSRIAESIKLRAPFQNFSTVMISNRKGIIKGIGQSKRNNLILDNFGTLFAGFFKATPASSTYVTIKDIAGNDSKLYTYGTVTVGTKVFNILVAGNQGTCIQVGSGTTSATRADIAIETAFGTSPEDDVFDTGTGSYSGGVISVAGAITAGGNGTINEVLLMGQWFDETADVFDYFAMFHDILASGEAFVASDTITVTYTINI